MVYQSDPENPCPMGTGVNAPPPTKTRRLDPVPTKAAAKLCIATHHCAPHERTNYEFNELVHTANHLSTGFLLPSPVERVLEELPEAFEVFTR